MTNGTKKTTAALAGAVVLASAGYALGSQSGDGSANAASGQPATTSTTPQSGPWKGGLRGPGAPDRPARPRFAHPFSGLADELGVSEDKLRDALEKVRTDRAKTEVDPMTEALAKALGKSVEEVRAAHEQVRDAKVDTFAAAVAKELGKSTAEVKAAWEKVKPAAGERPKGNPRDLLATAAKELGVSEDKLLAALRAARPERHDRSDHRAELAKALGVTEQQLEDAEDDVREALDDVREQHRKELAAALAKELGIDQAKVERALEDEPFFGRGFGPGHHGGPGHGHGGPFGRGPR